MEEQWISPILDLAAFIDEGIEALARLLANHAAFDLYCAGRDAEAKSAARSSTIHPV